MSEFEDLEKEINNQTREALDVFLDDTLVKAQSIVDQHNGGYTVEYQGSLDKPNDGLVLKPAKGMNDTALEKELGSRARKVKASPIFTKIRRDL